MNTLFKKGYLLAGVIMAANMFVVNEMKAMQLSSSQQNFQVNDQIPQVNEGKEKQVDLSKKEEKSGEQGFVDSLLSKVLTYENAINFFGGALFTLANSYYKFYENKPGFYFDYYFAGWNSNPFAKGYLQFCPNLNLGRGILWLIPGTYIFIKGINISEEEENAEDHFKPVYVSCLVAKRFENNTACIITLIGVFLLQGFISMPLTLHFSNFSISISLDSIIWGIVGKILELKDKKDLEEIKKTNEGKELNNPDPEIKE